MGILTTLAEKVLEVLPADVVRELEGMLARVSLEWKIECSR